MTDAWSEVNDPATTPERLAELASSHPHYGPHIAAHPNAYPELRAWIAAYAAPAPPLPPAPSAGAAADPFGASAAPADPFAVPAAGAAGVSAPSASTSTPPPSQRSSPTAPRSRKKLVIGIAVGAVALLLVGGGVGGWWLLSRLGGASSPEAAAEKLLSGAQSFDMLTLYGSLAPSEVGALKSTFQAVADAKPAEEGYSSTQDALNALKGAVTITTDDLQFETEELADGVVRVAWTDGSITVDGDADEIATIAYDAGVGAALRSSYESWGYSSSEIDESLENARRGFADSLDLPYVIDAEEVGDDIGRELSVVTVDEGTGWYVSPVLSAADAVYLGYEGMGYDLARLGDEVVTATPFATPEDAAAGLADAVIAGDVDEIAAALPLSERRLMSIYGEWLVDPYGMSGGAAWAGDSNLSTTAAEFSAVVTGDRARITVEEFGTEYASYDSWSGLEILDRFSVEGQCYDYVDQWSYDDGYWDEGYYSWQDEWVENWVLEENTSGSCLNDVPVLERLGVEEMAIIAVQEGGGWLVSPIATIADIGAIAAPLLVEYYEDDRLEELYG